MDQEKIGKFIKDIRMKENLSQQKFAEKYGVTYQAVSKWENGKNIPDLAILKKMCEEYDINLDDFLDAKKKDKKINKVLIYGGLVGIILIIAGVFLWKMKNDDFVFKTLSASCDNFNLYGSIAYNDTKSSIYISNITYCGEEDKKEYSSIKCSLYEVEGKAKYEISNSVYEEDEKITLEEFLKKVNFKVDNYESTCSLYKDNSLFLEIEGVLLDGMNVTYKIPLNLEDNCGL